MPFDSAWSDLIDRALAARHAAHAFRSRRIHQPIDATHVQLDGRTLVNFASNNYLGLTHHPRVIGAMTDALSDSGAGSGAAALVSGYSPAHALAETEIARWKGTESAVLLSSGYAANVAAVQTLSAVAESSGKKARFLLDKLAHASLIDAVRGSGLPFRIFPHNGMAKLERLLKEASPDEFQVVVTESIFSMDGDSADLRSLADLKSRHSFLLLLDEAHGSGVYGPNGAGYAAELGLSEMVDVSIVTLSKAVGVSGGAVCGTRAFCDAVLNFGRAFIFSTNVPPAIGAGIVAAIGVMRDEPGRQQRVQELARHFRRRVREMPIVVPDGDSPIIPVILGDEQTAMDAAAELGSQGMLVVAIRPPTVPRGGSRLRITLSSEHTDVEVETLLQSLSHLKNELR